MLFHMMTLSFLGLVCSLITGWFFLGNSFMSCAMLWLVVGAISLSWASSVNKKSVLWGMMLVILLFSFSVNSLFKFYIFFEMSLIPILLMILFWGNQPERLQAGLYLLIYTGLLSLPYIILVLMMKKSFFLLTSMNCAFFTMVLLMAPFLVKMPILGLHFWLPKAHVEASTSGSMVLAGILLKLGSYGIYRIMTIISMTYIMMASSFWMILSILASVLTFMQTDLKKLVAYSSVTHMTFLMISLCTNNKLLFFNCLILSLSHGWVSMGMFFNSGSLSNHSNSRLSLLLSSEMKFHWSIIFTGLILVMNAALPPFPSFFTELMTISSLMSLSLFSLFFILYSLMVCYYNTYMFMWISHYKNIEQIFNKANNSEALLFSMFCWLSIFTILWMFLI